MKLSIPELREEAFELKTSVKNIKKMHQYQLGIAKGDEAFEKARAEGSVTSLTRLITENDARWLESSEDFLVEMLGLSKKEKDKLEELERADFTSLTSRVILILQGYDLSAIEQIQEEANDGEKKVPAQVSASSSTTTS